jgi:glutathione peroxidase
VLLAKFATKSRYEEGSMLVIRNPLVLVFSLAAMVVFSVGGNLSAMAATPLTGEMKTIDGSTVDLADYKGKVVLVVNVASRCGYTGQYAGMQKLYDDYKDKGFVILGFPANDFGAQEPGSDAQIAEFCSSKYGVTFPMFSKITVKGAGKSPLYETLTTSSDPQGEVGWNFEKFLIGKDGSVVGRFKSGVAPADAKLISAIEAELAK